MGQAQYGHLSAGQDQLFQCCRSLVKFPLHGGDAGHKYLCGHQGKEITRLAVQFASLGQHRFSFRHAPLVPVRQPQVYGDVAASYHLCIG